jgi:hypothetical protein
MSKVRIEDVAISSEDDEDVTAMKSVMSKAMAPFFPKSAAAPNAAERPEETCELVMLFGYVGNAGLSVKATAARPSVVAKPKGMANQAKPPRMYP